VSGPLSSVDVAAAAAGAPARAHGRAAFAFIFVTVALDMLALGIVLPVLPRLVTEFLGGDAGGGAAMYGVFGTVWASMQFVFMPVLGALSDRFGRRTVVLVSNVGLGLDYLLMAVAPTLSWLFVGRVISGITAASLSTAGAYVADVTPPERRAASFGKLGAAFGLGFILGPAVGGLLGTSSLRQPFWTAAALSLANAAYGFFVLPESLPPERRARFVWRKANPLGSLELLRSHRELSGLAGAGFLSRLAHDSLPSTFVIYAQYRYGWDAGMVGLSLAAVGACSMVVQAGLVGPVVSWLGERRALFGALAFGTVGFGIHAIAPTGGLFLLGVPFIAFYGLAGPSMQGLMSRRVGPSEQGRLQGAIASVAGIAGVVAPILFTQVFAASIGAGGPEVPGAPFLVAALLLVGALTAARLATRAG
jgi:DHA1 family tetracycline resistance protein-like MFS transporter